jgi:hypothetical protein
MSERDIQHEVFNCTKMGSKVTITREILVHRSSATGEIDARFTTPIDCDHKSDCGVGESSGRSISYDWTKCVHPDLKQ